MKLFEKLFDDTKVGIKATIVATAIAVLGMLILIFNKGVGILICSIITAIAISAGIPTLINAIKEKNKKALLITAGLLLINVVAIVLEGIFL